MATSSASSSNSELSNHPALKFDTKNMLLYYVHSNGSHGSYEPGKDIIAGNPSPKPFKDNYSLFAAMHDRLTGFPKPTDFILVTPDAPWAFVKALLDHESGKEGGVMVSLINPSKLDPKSLVNVNQVFKQIGRNQHRMYDAQYLVWGRIPADAVTRTLSWADLVGSGLYKQFPALQPNYIPTGYEGDYQNDPEADYQSDYETDYQNDYHNLYLTVEKTRKKLRYMAKGSPLAIPKIISFVTHGLRLDLESFSHAQEVMTFVGLSRGYCTLKELQRFENFEISGRLKIDEKIYWSRQHGPPLRFDVWMRQREPQTAEEYTTADVLERLVMKDRPLWRSLLG